jgi:subfamily B ATP-binding cassette protein MsbA
LGKGLICKSTLSSRRGQIDRRGGRVSPTQRGADFAASAILIDDVVQKHRQDLLSPLVAAVGAAVVVQAVTSYALTQLLSTSAQRPIADMRINVQQHIGRLPVRYYDANKTGAFVSRIMSDVEGVRNLVGTGLVEFIGGVLTAIIAFSLLLKINATLTFVALAFLVIFGAILQKAFKSVRPIFRERGKINADLTGRLTESLGGVRIVKGFHGEDREAAVFETGAMRLFENVRKTLFATSIIGLASTLLMGIVSITVMIVGGRMIVSATDTSFSAAEAIAPRAEKTAGGVPAGSLHPSTKQTMRRNSHDRPSANFTRVQ